jgi:hypothetical protein
MAAGSVKFAGNEQNKRAKSRTVFFFKIKENS